MRGGILLNQIECWFSILMRRLLKRSSFTSTQDLSDRILAFIEYFNRTLAKPFEWKYEGYPEAVSTGGLFLPRCTSGLSK
jgi:transposase